MTVVFVLLWTLVVVVAGRSDNNNGVGKTPPMGWNPWNLFGCGIDEGLIEEMAFHLSTKLKPYGYEYLNLDDCWQSSRNASGYIREDTQKFPSGIPHLVDRVHSLGLKFGLYSDSGRRTCQGRPGGYGHEALDAETYASWRIDYLKYDNCYTGGLPGVKTRYRAMHDALEKHYAAANSSVFFSLCEWGVEDPATWASGVGNSWRTTGDIEKSWGSVTSIADANNRWHEYAGPGGWNDPDMLQVGTGGPLTTREQRSHFTLWALMKAPLLLAMDLREEIPPEILEIVTNREIIAVHQDPLGVQGHKRRRLEFESNGGEGEENAVEVWAGNLSGNEVAVVLWNRSPQSRVISVDFSDVVDGDDRGNVTTKISALVRNLWEHVNRGVHTDSFSATVASHDVAALRLSHIWIETTTT